jgi:hypothetical protein
MTPVDAVGTLDAARSKMVRKPFAVADPQTFRFRAVIWTSSPVVGWNAGKPRSILTLHEVGPR